MSETTRAIGVIGAILLVGFILYLILPNKTTLDTAQKNVTTQIESAKDYVDRKTRQAVESSKKHSYGQDVQLLQEQMGGKQQEVQILQEQVGELLDRIKFLEDYDQGQVVNELKEQNEHLVLEIAQLKIAVENLETLARNAAEIDKALLLGAEAHYKEFKEYKAFTDNLFNLLGVALSKISGELSRLDAELTKQNSQERSVLVKHTIIKCVRCYDYSRPRRFCR